LEYEQPCFCTRALGSRLAFTPLVQHDYGDFIVLEKTETIGSATPISDFLDLLFGRGQYDRKHTRRVILKEGLPVRKSTSWVVLIYALLLMALGLLAYVTVGSKTSFYMGMSLGVLLIISSILMFFGIKLGRHFALAISIILTVTFAVRYSITHKEIPAVLAVLSAAFFLFLLARSVSWKR